MIEYRKKRNDELIQECKKELKELESRIPPNHVDSDILINSLEDLWFGRINKLNMIVRDGKINIGYTVKDKCLIILCKGVQHKLDRFLIPPNKIALKRIGFRETEDGAEYKIQNFELDRVIEVLQITSILIYDGLSLYGGMTGIIITE